MTGRRALADATRSDVWTQEQRAALRAAFTALGEVLDGLILLKGRVVEQSVSMATLPVTLSIPFSGKPKAIVVLSATRDEDAATISLPPILWTYAPTATENLAFIKDIDLEDGYDYTATILLVEEAT